MTTTIRHASLFDRIADLLPADLREHFYRRMAHLDRLGPDDDILQVAEAMGYLALITRQTPVEIAAERLKLEALFKTTVAALNSTHEGVIAYHEDLDQRLASLPSEIALDAENVAGALSESVRQRFCETGLPAVSELLATQAQNMRNTSSEFMKAFEGFSNPDYGALPQLRRALSSMQADLTNATSHLRTLTHALARDLQRTVALFSLVALVLGFFLGVQWAKQP